MMLIVMKMLYLYPMEVFNFELRFSENVMENGCISLSFLAACRITLSLFSQTRSERHISQVPPSQFYPRELYCNMSH